MYISISVTLENSKTLIKIYETTKGSLKAILKGHTNLIHDI